MKDKSSDNQWQTSAKQRNKIKPFAREMRKTPTMAEEKLWKELKEKKLNGIKFRRQHSIGTYVVDFYSRESKIIIEVDGGIHDLRIEEDSVRQQFLEESGYEVIRFKNEEVMNSIEKVLEKIKSIL